MSANQYSLKYLSNKIQYWMFNLVGIAWLQRQGGSSPPTSVIPILFSFLFQPNYIGLNWVFIWRRVKSKLQPYTCHGSLNYNLKLQNQTKHTPVLLNPSKTQPWVVLWPVFADVALWGPQVSGPVWFWWPVMNSKFWPLITVSNKVSL